MVREDEKDIQINLKRETNIIYIYIYIYIYKMLLQKFIGWVHNLTQIKAQIIFKNKKLKLLLMPKFA